MAKTSHTKHTTKAVVQTDGKGALQARRWVGWTSLSVVGLVMVILGSLQSQSYQNSISRTAMVVTDMQADAQALASEALLAARGNPGAFDNLKNRRNRIGVSMTLLERGGMVAPSDPAPVMALHGRNGISLDGIRTGLAGFDSQVRALEESAGQLRSASVAEQELSDALDQVARAVQNIERTPALNTGEWGQALSVPVSTLSRPEMRTMRVIFAPLKGAEALQGSWAQQFAQTSSRLKELAAAAQQDNSLSGAAKSQVSGLSDAADLLARSSAVLAQTLPVRLSAQQLQAPILEATSALQKPLGQVGTSVIAMQASRPLSWYLMWVGVVMGAVGLLGLTRAAMSMGQDHWLASQESRAGHGLGDSLDRISRQLKRMTGKNGTVMPNARLEEDPDAGTFPLVSTINRILEGQQQYGEGVAGSVDSMLGQLSDVSGPVNRSGALAARLMENSSRSSTLARAIAQELAQVSHQPMPQNAQKMVAMITDIELVMQEGAFKMDALREKVQEASKKLKRLAESAQNIASTSDMIDEISRRVKVLSTNAAIEAAAHGEGGRRFAVLAKEIERLSQSAHEAAGDIARVVQDIQADAQETVATMELGTTEVVASTQLTTRASSALRELEKSAVEQSRGLELAMREVEKQALAGVKLSQQCDEAASLSKEAKGETEQASQSLEKSKSTCRGMKRELGADNGF